MHATSSLTNTSRSARLAGQEPGSSRAQEPQDGHALQGSAARSMREERIGWHDLQHSGGGGNRTRRRRLPVKSALRCFVSAWTGTRAARKGMAIQTLSALPVGSRWAEASWAARGQGRGTCR